MPMNGVRVALALASGASAVVHDASMMVQRDVSSPQSQALHIAGMSTTLRELKQASKMMQVQMPELPPDDIQHAAHQMQDIDEGRAERLAKTWKIFEEKAQAANSPDPAALLGHARAAFLQTGAMADLKAMARAQFNSTRKLARGVVPLDSMVLGFSTSVAPWNNVLKMFHIPLIKQQFSLIANFYGPMDDGQRMCITSQTAIDSDYDGPGALHSSNEVGGITMIVGPAKWDNVPGWQFGSSGGFDNVNIVDVADFGWQWTLSRAPETIGFWYLVNLVQTMRGAKGKIVSVLQTDAQKRRIHTHGSTWVGHTWCSPDWENAPLMLEPEIVHNATTQVKEAPTNPADSWDPQPEDP